MASGLPEKTQVSIVLLGAFNPRLFHPAWFGKQGLMPEDEAKQAEIAIIHEQVAQFSTGSHEVQVTTDRFFAATTRDPYDALRDLVVGTFLLLDQTPIRAMGINRDSHFKMPSEADWHKVGHTLVPKENWPFLREPGVRMLIEEGLRPDDEKGYIRVHVAPSEQIVPGVSIQVNDHYAWNPADGETAVNEAVALLATAWHDSMERATKMMTAIVTVP